MKVGTVALIGRPNTGKSTLINNLIGRKVTITSPKPQTTQFPIYAAMDVDLESQRAREAKGQRGKESAASAKGFGELKGQIIFVDTPGIFAKHQDKTHKSSNVAAEETLSQGVDAILYIVDHTRQRGMEENRVLGILRKVNVPKILVINKIDIREPDYRAQYKFLEDEFDTTVEVSALKPLNLPILLEKILEVLPDGERAVETEALPFPAMNLDARTFIEENIREKAFLVLRRELPYQIRIVVDEMTERPNGVMYIRARLMVPSLHYKKMVIGAGGQRIKQISAMSRKELEVATGKKIFLELVVEAE